jgi:hypothetical protein
VTVTFPPKPGESWVLYLVVIVGIIIPLAALFVFTLHGTSFDFVDLPRFRGVTVREKSAIIAVAFTLLPVAVAAWIKRSREMFVAGAMGAIVGLFFAPVGAVEWDHHATERSLMIAYTGWNLQGTLPAAALIDRPRAGQRSGSATRTRSGR